MQVHTAGVSDLKKKKEFRFESRREQEMFFFSLNYLDLYWPSTLLFLIGTRGAFGWGKAAVA